MNYLRTVQFCFVIVPIILHATSVQADNQRIFANGFDVARLQLNEVNPAIPGSRDLVELLTVEGGSTANIQLLELNSGDTSGTILATLPDLQVATGDFVVLHFNPSTETDESISKSDCAVSTCYPSAWDINASPAGILFSNVVLLLEGANGDPLDAAAFVKGSSNTPTDFPLAVRYIQSIGLWLPADCNGTPCTYLTTPSVNFVSVDWSLVSASASGNSASRKSANKNAAVWSVGSSSFGASNP